MTDGFCLRCEPEHYTPHYKMHANDSLALRKENERLSKQNAILSEHLSKAHQTILTLKEQVEGLKAIANRPD